MVKSMNAAVAGLRAHQTRMDVLSHNIANVNTWGFKSRTANFQDSLYVNTINGAAGNTNTGRQGGINTSQLGYGSTVSSISSNFSTSSGQYTGNSLDCMVNGPAFFIVGPWLGADGEITPISGESFSNSGLFLSRVGMFSVDSNGYLVDGKGNYVYGYQAAEGYTNTPTTTTQYTITTNTTTVVTGTRKQTDDKAHDLLEDDQGNYYYTEDADGDGTEELYNADGTPASGTQDTTGGTITLDGVSLSPSFTSKIEATKVSDGIYNITIMDGTKVVETYSGVEKKPDGSYVKADGTKIVTDGNGTITITTETTVKKTTTDTPPNSEEKELPSEGNVKKTIKTDVKITKETETAAYELVGMYGGDSDAEGATLVGEESPSEGKTMLTPIRIPIALTKGEDGTYTVNADGERYEIVTYTVSRDGTIVGVDKDSVPHTIGQIAVATVENPNGLEQTNGYLYTIGANAGRVTASETNASTGTIDSNYLEMSNVDLAYELSIMITTQRGYQANTKIITVTDQMLEELVNMKR